MNEPDHEESHSYLLSRNRFVTLIVVTILVSLLLVIVALVLYAKSGAAQVDLSRPGYEDVREQAIEEDPSFEGFSATGPIDKAALDQFELLFSERAKSVINTKVFDDEVIGNKALEIESN